MLIPIVIQMLLYKVKIWKSVPFALALTVCGTMGTYLLFFIENHWIGGTSFYGAVFFVPVLFIVLFKLFGLTYDVCMDLCAPAECIMLVIMKIQCLLSGCCKGKVIFVGSENEFIFPSQIAELLNAFAIGIILLLISRNKKLRGIIYPVYMLIYGTTRLALNCFRADLSVFAIGLPAGHFWSILSILTGGIWLIIYNTRCKKSNKILQN